MKKIALVGLGYVGLPVAVAFGKKQYTIGFDINQQRINQLKLGHDCTGEVAPKDLEQADIFFTSQVEQLSKANFFIIAVPTPVDRANHPDLSILKEASRFVGSALKPGDIVVYESTVYPGATEEECIPVLEKASHLRSGIDFKVGYSPERINPGDLEHSFSKIMKIVSAQDRESLNQIAEVYDSVVEAGTYKAESIRVAEAAKVIENTQRDLNIGLMNELSIIFDRMHIDTKAVLKAAGTKWNFLPFEPGLVGGHCIGVDPYYLTYKAQQTGYTPQIILAARKLNDGMSRFIAQKTIKKMICAGHPVLDNHVTIMGVTFKQNCPDIRNSKVFDIIDELRGYGVEIQAYDPYADREATLEEYGVSLMEKEELKPASAIIFAVAHDEFTTMTSEQVLSLGLKRPVIIDVKGIFNADSFPPKQVHFWRL